MQHPGRRHRARLSRADAPMDARARGRRRRARRRLGGSPVTAWRSAGSRDGPSGTVVIDTAGKLSWFSLDPLRRHVPLARAALALRQAVVAVEDHRFWRHPGVDPVGVGRAVVHNLQRGGRSRGRAPSPSSWRARSSSRGGVGTQGARGGPRAAPRSAPAEGAILELYLNRVPLGGVYGVEGFCASRFGKGAAELTLGRAPWSPASSGRLRRSAPRPTTRGRSRGARRVLGADARGRIITPEEERRARGERPRVAAGPPGGRRAPDGRRSTCGPPSARRSARRTRRVAGPRELRPPCSGLRSRRSRRPSRLPRRAPGRPRRARPRDRRGGRLVGGADFDASTYNRAVLAAGSPGPPSSPSSTPPRSSGDSPVVPCRRGAIAGRSTGSASASAAPLPARDPAGCSPSGRRSPLRQPGGRRLQEGAGTRRWSTWRARGLPQQPAVPVLALGTGSVTPLQLTAAYAVFANGGYACVRTPSSRSRTSAGTRCSGNGERRRSSPGRCLPDGRPAARRGRTGTGEAARHNGAPPPARPGRRTTTATPGSSVSRPGGDRGLGRVRPPGADRGRGYAARIAVPIWADFVRRAAAVRPPGGSRRLGDPRRRALPRLARAADDGCPTYLEQFKKGDVGAGGSAARCTPARCASASGGRWDGLAGRIREALRREVSRGALSRPAGAGPPPAPPAG